MKPFLHHHAKSIEEAIALLAEHQYKAKLNAGGTDLLGILKNNILPDYPKALINIKTIKGLNHIKKDGKKLRIEALTKLSAIVNSQMVKGTYPVLADAARSVATPNIRNMATLGGNLAQDVRCWYYRYPKQIGGPILCLRKGIGPCLAVQGDHRYHAIMGGKKCYAVCPSDIAVALSALNAQIVLSGPEGERKVSATNFYNPLGNVLRRNEMIRSVEIPEIPDRTQQVFLKFTLRKPVDFAVVSVASVMTVKDGICSDARIAMGAIAPGPVRATTAEKFLEGRTIDEEAATRASELALEGARPLRQNGYKVQITKTLIKRAVLHYSQG